MSDSCVKVGSTEVYEHKIFELCDSYTSNLDDPDRMTAQNKAAFTGLLKYIQRYYIKYHKPAYSDISAYDQLFSVYTELCYKYDKKPTLLGFSIMCDISMETINAWKEGRTRKLKPEFTETVKKWYAECEAALYDGATEQNSIGCIFALKANYGYTETAPAQVGYTGERRKTADEIAAAHGVALEDHKKAIPAAEFVQIDESQK